MKHPPVWRCRLALVSVLAGAVTLAPLPLAAADNPPSPGLQASALRIASAERLVTPKPAEAKSAQATGEVDLKSGSFFKTPTGLVLIAVLAAGTGYAIYSTSHDRVKSQVR